MYVCTYVHHTYVIRRNIGDSGGASFAKAAAINL